MTQRRSKHRAAALSWVGALAVVSYPAVVVARPGWPADATVAVFASVGLIHLLALTPRVGLPMTLGAPPLAWARLITEPLRSNARRRTWTRVALLAPLSAVMAAPVASALGATYALSLCSAGLAAAVLVLWASTANGLFGAGLRAVAMALWVLGLMTLLLVSALLAPLAMALGRADALAAHGAAALASAGEGWRGPRRRLGAYRRRPGSSRVRRVAGGRTASGFGARPRARVSAGGSVRSGLGSR